MARWSSRDVTVYLEDDSGLSLTLGPGDGAISIAGFEADGVSSEAVYDQGSFDGLVDGPDKTYDFSISLNLRPETLTSAVADRVLDAVRKTGLWAAATSTAGVCNSMAHRIRVVLTRCGVVTEIVLGVTRISADLSLQVGAPGNTLAISGTCYTAPVIT